MNYAMVNDTSLWHAGSEACVTSIYFAAKAQGLDRMRTYATNDRIFADGFAGCPLVIVNGEGSMHDDRKAKAAGWILDAITKAKAQGCIVWLVNTLWFRMSDGAARIVRECCDYIQCRDMMSSKAMDRQCITHTLLLDASVPMNTGVAPDWCKDFLAMKDGLPDTYYHHGAIAGLILRIPFTYRHRNGRQTPPKVEGIFTWLGLTARGDDWIPPIDDLKKWRAVWAAFDRLPRFRLPCAVPLEV